MPRVKGTKPHYRFMKAEEQKEIKSWRKLHKEVDEFIYVWTRWRKWEEEPPVVVLYRGEIVGYHGVSFTKSKYTNSASQFVLDRYRGEGYAGGMINFILQESCRRGMERLRFRCPHKSLGMDCWAGFGVKPFGSCEKDYWFDLSLRGVTDSNKLMKMGSKLHLPPTADKRRLSWYRRGEVVAMTPEWRKALCQ